MSILRSLHTGAAGMRSHSEALGVTGDNIANVSTVGFKRSRAVFDDILGRSVAGASAMNQGGAGSRLAHVQQMWSQGALLTTEAQTDLAINGNGLFVVKGNVNGIDSNFYTRAGQFNVDNDGFLVNPDGLRLQGYPASEDGTIGATLGDLQVDGGTVAAVVTENVDMATNLDSDAAVGTWNPADPNGSATYSTTTTVYDSLGASHDVSVYFVKNGPASWEWHAMVDGGELAGGTPGTPTEGASGTLTFTTTGALDTETSGGSSWDFNGAAAGQAIAFDFGTSITGDGGTGMDGSTQYAAPSSVVSLRQDGFAAGQIDGIAIEADGTVMGLFNNGQRRALGQVAVAEFGNNEGLARSGHNVWSQTEASGEPLVGAAGAGGRGSIVSGALEGSNVDLGSEFVDMIQYQRGFSAASKIITTADEMYQVVSLKR